MYEERESLRERKCVLLQENPITILSSVFGYLIDICIIWREKKRLQWLQVNPRYKLRLSWTSKTKKKEIGKKYSVQIFTEDRFKLKEKSAKVRQIVQCSVAYRGQ